jgi:hypothetical protein
MLLSRVTFSSRPGVSPADGDCRRRQQRRHGRPHRQPGSGGPLVPQDAEKCYGHVEQQTSAQGEQWARPGKPTQGTERDGRQAPSPHDDRSLDDPGRVHQREGPAEEQATGEDLKHRQPE